MSDCAGRPAERGGSISGPAAGSADGAIWCAFAAALGYPGDELLASIRGGALAQQLRRLLLENDAAICSDEDWAALQDAGKNADDLQIEYTRLFDSAAGGACALYGSLLHGAQMKTMEEVVRFYNLFGATLGDDTTETPDHLTVELEFLHCLAYGEADRRSRGEDPSAYARARRDFIARHPGRMVSLVRGRMADLQPMPYYAALFRLLDRCLQNELQRLELQYGPASTPKMRMVGP